MNKSAFTTRWKVKLGTVVAAAAIGIAGLGGGTAGATSGPVGIAYQSQGTVYPTYLTSNSDISCDTHTVTATAWKLPSTTAGGKIVQLTLTVWKWTGSAWAKFGSKSDFMINGLLYKSLSVTNLPAGYYAASYLFGWANSSGTLVGFTHRPVGGYNQQPALGWSPSPVDTPYCQML